VFYKPFLATSQPPIPFRQAFSQLKVPFS